MNLTRKEFLRIVAGSVVVAGAGSIVHAVVGGEERPAEGAKKRWGMVIDLQRCRQKQGCTLCSQACHRTHNVPRIPDPAHEVKWIWQEPADKVFPFQHFPDGEQAAAPLPVLCNHCAQPACTRVCPTRATWKREDGVVMMDYHRCIGCRYCMAACPYGSRSFNYQDPRPHVATVNSEFPTRTIGVVEKCNFCEERLATGQPPACIAACPSQALVFGDLNDEHSPARQLLKGRYAVQRQPELGCGPSIFYLV